MTMLQNANAISAGGYDINNSLRFRSSASAYLNRTPASAGDTQKWTWSAWIKLGKLSTFSGLFGALSGTDRMYIGYGSSAKWQIYGTNAGTDFVEAYSTGLYRDPSAWYHLVIAIDTTQATAANRLKMYVNGNQETVSFTTNMTLNANTSINKAIATVVGETSVGNDPFDGYMAEVNFIDGSQKTPSDFGETDSTTGVWKPKAYTGTYGTNGFYLKFSDIATTSGSNAGLGKDFSGNTNYWTTNNISVTSGTTYDAMKDSPTNTSATVANYAVLNPLDSTTSGNMSLAYANMQMTTSAANRSRVSTALISSGKWYAEAVFSTSSGSLSGCMFGLVQAGDVGSVVGSYVGSSANSYGYNQGGDKYNNGSGTAYGASYTTGDIIGIAFDADAGSVTFYKNNTSQGTAFTGLSTTALWSIGVSGGISSASANIVVDVNFGQRPFSYTPPTGYVALNTYNLPTPTILQGNKYMDATLYTGTGATLSVTNAGSFKPDFVWIKSRSVVENHLAYDSVRGTNQRIYPNLTNAESTATNQFNSFNSNGFTLGADPSQQANITGATMVAWQWQAGQGSTSSNTSGSITSTVSVNATAGFSVVTWTATGSNATIGHGLGVAPKMIITKGRNAVNGWNVYTSTTGNGNYLRLDTTAASTSGSTYWNNTSPTSTVFSTGTWYSNTETYVAYCWAEIAGFSKFGSYTGNGSADGVFVYTGFLPKYILIKRTDTTASWVVMDTSRGLYNASYYYLLPNLTDADSGPIAMDFLSNGFKLRLTSAAWNASGGTYIYAAFAENPFKNANAR